MIAESEELLPEREVFFRTDEEDSTPITAWKGKSSVVYNSEHCTFLDAEEERRLLILGKNGDEEAKSRVIQSYIKYALKCAHDEYSRVRAKVMCSVEDFEQAAVLGLVIAFERFDLSRENRYATYANVWVLKQLRLETANMLEGIGVPDGVNAAASRIRVYNERFIAENGREPTEQEIAEGIGMGIGIVQRAMSTYRRNLSLDAPSSGTEDDADSLMKHIADDSMEMEEIMSMIEISRVVEEEIDRLPDRERKYLRLRFGLEFDEPCSLEEIAMVFDVTREWARKVVDRGMLMLKENARIQQLRSGE